MSLNQGSTVILTRVEDSKLIEKMSDPLSEGNSFRCEVCDSDYSGKIALKNHIAKIYMKKRNYTSAVFVIKVFHKRYT